MAKRFPPLPDSELSPGQRELVDVYRGSWRKALATPDGGLGGPLDATLRSPGYARAIMVMSDYFRGNSALPADLKELVVLLIAGARKCGFEWQAHVPLALNAGIPQDAIEAIAQRKKPEGLSPSQAATYTVVAQLTETHRVTDEAFESLSSAVGPEVLMDILGLAGHYWTIAGILNTAQVQHAKPAADGMPRLPGSEI